MSEYQELIDFYSKDDNKYIIVIYNSNIARCTPSELKYFIHDYIIKNDIIIDSINLRDEIKIQQTKYGKDFNSVYSKNSQMIYINIKNLSFSTTSDTSHTIKRSIGQLYFYKWLAESNNIRKYIAKNIKYIRCDMDTTKKCLSKSINICKIILNNNKINQNVIKNHIIRIYKKAKYLQKVRNFKSIFDK